MKEYTDRYRKTLKLGYKNYETLIAIKESLSRGARRAEIIKDLNIHPTTYDRNLRIIKEFEREFPTYEFVPDPDFQVPNSTPVEVPSRVSVLDKLMMNMIAANASIEGTTIYQANRARLDPEFREKFKETCRKAKEEKSKEITEGLALAITIFSVLHDDYSLFEEALKDVHT